MIRKALLLSTLILGQTFTLANEDAKESKIATNMSEAITEGKISGGLSLYGQKFDFKKQNDDFKNFSYGNANLTLGYETNPLYGFSIGAEFRGNAKIAEKNRGDYVYNAPFENEALLSQGFINYSIEDLINLKIGRQELSKEWLSYYQEAAVLDINAIENSIISLGYSRKKSESGIDLSEHFYKPTEKGVYFLELENSSLENISLKPYIYVAPETITFYGLKANFEVENLDLMLHYATSNISSKFEDENGDKVEDNAAFHTEANLEIIEDLNTKLGFIKTDKKGGAEHMSLYGDNLSPFEDGNQSYGLNAKTYYAGISYKIANIELETLYGITKYGEENSKEKELNLSATYNFTDDISVGLMWVNVNADKNEEYSNYNKYLASAEYRF